MLIATARGGGSSRAGGDQDRAALPWHARADEGWVVIPFSFSEGREEDNVPVSVLNMATTDGTPVRSVDEFGGT